MARIHRHKVTKSFITLRGVKHYIVVDRKLQLTGKMQLARWRDSSDFSALYLSVRLQIRAVCRLCFCCEVDWRTRWSSNVECGTKY